MTSPATPDNTAPDCGGPSQCQQCKAMQSDVNTASSPEDELDGIIQQMLVDYTAWVNGQPVPWNIKKAEARASLLAWSDRRTAAVLQEQIRKFTQDLADYTDITSEPRLIALRDKWLEALNPTKEEQHESQTVRN